MPSRIQTFPLDHPRRGEIETALNLTPFQAIAQSDVGGGGRCYWNVDEQVRRFGGQSVLGWKIQYWPNHFVSAVYHAVWWDPVGKKLVDVTAKLPSDTVPGTTFSEDQSHVIDLTMPQFIRNKYYRLNDSAEVRELIGADEALLDFQEDFAARRLAAGATWRAVGGYTMDPELNAAFRPDYIRMEELGRRLLEAIEDCDRSCPNSHERPSK